MNAHERVEPRGLRAARAARRPAARPTPDAAEVVATRRAIALRRRVFDSGASSAHALQLASDFADHEPVRVAAQLFEVARQQMSLRSMMSR